MNLIRGNLDDLRVFYDEHHGRLQVEFSTVADALSGWEVWRLEDDGPIAVIITKDGQGHISAYDGAKVGTRRIKWALNRLGINHTSVGEKFIHGHLLAKRLGFHVETTERGVTHYVRII